MNDHGISSRIQSVSELTGSIRGLLETGMPFVSVAGEISNLRNPGSGHIYFTLKDQHCQIRAVMFRQQQKYIQAVLDNGQQVLCRGRITVYEARGEYQIILDMIEPLGAGRLRAAFEELKQRLAAEGLFDDFHKKPLPFLPAHISLVTSTEGAAIHDFLKSLHNRHPGLKIDVFPVRVQGENASGEISEAINVINKINKTEVIVLCRGGGSIEDLWAFNEEIVARAIFNSRIPVISAVGHETDFTISDFTADFRAATPTAAAEVIIPPRDHLRKRVGRAFASFCRAFTGNLEQLEYRVESHKKLLGDPSLMLENYTLKLKHGAGNLQFALDTKLLDFRYRLKDLTELLMEQNPNRYLALNTLKLSEIAKRIKFAIRIVLDRKQQQFGSNIATLDAVSPLSVLGRGYSITRKTADGEVVKDIAQLKTGDEIETILARGNLISRITATDNREKTAKK